MNKYKLILSLLIIVLCLPFSTALMYDTGFINGIIDSKIFSLNVICFLCIIVYLICSIFFVQLPIFTFNRIDLCYALFVLFCSTNYFIKFDFSNDSLISLLLVLLIYFIWKAVLKAGELSGMNVPFGMIASLFFIGILECIYAVAQIIGILPSLHASYPVTGTFHNPGILGIFLAVLFSCASAIYLFIKGTSKADVILRGLSLISLILCFVILPSTNSRDAWLAAFITGVVLLCLYFPFIKTWIRKWWLFYLVGFVFIISASLVGLFYYKPGSATGRMVIWKECLVSIKSHPLTGIGFNQFANRQPIIQYEYFKKAERSATEIMLADKVDYVFNDYIQLVTENGLVGLGLFLILLYLVSSAYFKSKLYNCPLTLAVGASGLCLMIAALFSYPFQNIYFWCLFSFFIAIVSSKSTGRFTLKVPRNLFTTAFSVVLAIWCGLMILTLHREYSFKKRLFNANSLVGAGQIEEALIEYRNIYRQIPHEKQILLGYGKCLFLTGHYKESLDTLMLAKRWIEDPFLSIGIAQNYEALGQFTRAENELQRSILMIPNRIYPKYLLFKLYLKQNKLVAASHIGHLILNAPIKIVSPAIMDMRGEVSTFLKKQNL